MRTLYLGMLAAVFAATLLLAANWAAHAQEVEQVVEELEVDVQSVNEKASKNAGGLNVLEERVTALEQQQAPAYDDTALWNAHDDQEARISSLEESPGGGGSSTSWEWGRDYFASVKDANTTVVSATGSFDASVIELSYSGCIGTLAGSMQLGSDRPLVTLARVIVDGVASQWQVICDNNVALGGPAEAEAEACGDPLWISEDDWACYTQSQNLLALINRVRGSSVMWKIPSGSYSSVELVLWSKCHALATSCPNDNPLSWIGQLVIEARS